MPGVQDDYLLDLLEDGWQLLPRFVGTQCFIDIQTALNVNGGKIRYWWAVLWSLWWGCPCAVVGLPLCCGGVAPVLWWGCIVNSFPGTVNTFGLVSKIYVNLTLSNMPLEPLPQSLTLTQPLPLPLLNPYPFRTLTPFEPLPYPF